MDKFPEDLNESAAREALAKRLQAEKDAQETYLCQARKEVYEKIKLSYGEKVIEISINKSLDKEHRLILWRELYSRFPNAMWRANFNLMDPAPYCKVLKEEDIEDLFNHRLVF